MWQAQVIAGERGRRRSGRLPESLYAGHMVKNHVTVIVRWGATGRDVLFRDFG